jgi:hypothetical protein
MSRRDGGGLDDLVDLAFVSAVLSESLAELMGWAARQTRLQIYRRQKHWNTSANGTGHIHTTRLLCCLSCRHCSGGPGEQRMPRKRMEVAVTVHKVLMEAESAGKRTCESWLGVVKVVGSVRVCSGDDSVDFVC